MYIYRKQIALFINLKQLQNFLTINTLSVTAVRNILFS